MNQIDREALEHLKLGHDVDECEECPVAIVTLVSTLIDQGHGNVLASDIRKGFGCDEVCT